MPDLPPADVAQVDGANVPRSMGEGPLRLLWLDFETTGLGPEAEVVEVGAILTDEHLRELGEFSTLIQSVRGLWELGAIELAGRSGLLTALTEAMGGSRPPLRMAEAEARLLRWLHFSRGADGYCPLVLAGSGVHFDRTFIKRDWPTLDAQLAYWHYDTGVVRRYWQLAGFKEDRPASAHRALADARDALDQMREFVARLA